ncbi:HxlR family transcriptional regulator [Pseudorhodoplanes sinuspersici]|uniref:Transcriptional regulator n=2 Tax=Pseudorhodoplanes sinuspersici TaxID=1235591 RepID=A0A1W6ZVR5_9HYPH|nr:helix-turn-helix domain-containing protein [Pseudorhodoplanes sinuspersici]ARQ01406.1 transcriptional regulator [Pseudorhodoplanes sinuspersici]RKE73090.1 HxlR family transcriptional regulator [Pseudorhodoplanes sinuspersici]
MNTIDSQRSGCPIATTLDLAGDKWTFVIVRDMLTGKSRFGEFLASPETIPTNILTERLKRMEKAGLLLKRAYQLNPPRFEYLLSKKGMALLPILQEMCRWANTFIPGTWTPPKSFMSRKTDTR